MEIGDESDGSAIQIDEEYDTLIEGVAKVDANQLSKSLREKRKESKQLTLDGR